LALAAVFAVTSVAPAGGHTRLHSDRNDTRASLDVKRVGIGHGGGKIGVAVEFYEDWTVGYFRNSQCGGDLTGNDLCLGFDTTGSREYVDRLIYLTYRNGGLRACLLWSGRCRAYVRVERIDSRTMRFLFRRSDWGEIRGSGVVRWGGQLNDARTGINDYFPDGYREGAKYQHDVS
jgi:hypothetical protein